MWRPDIILYNKCVVLGPSCSRGRGRGCTGRCQPWGGSGRVLQREMRGYGRQGVLAADERARD